jgi:hypothetical protein
VHVEDAAAATTAALECIPGVLGYAYQMGLRPQTLYALADSPVGLAAYLLDHDARSYELISRAFAGHPGGLTRDDVLDNITLFWLTNTAISSARLYWGSFDERGNKVRLGVPRIIQRKENAPEFDYGSFYAKTGA